jgi:gamma-glutamylcyclotransferase (GGCT)/AIG2-like uncharacterized protein YtfP
MDIFVYGTLMLPEIWFKVTKEKNDCDRALLNGYSRSKLIGEVYPGIFEKKGCAVSGIIYYNVSCFAVNKLDIFEGEKYRRTKVVVNIDNKIDRAETYVISAKFQHLITEDKWDFEEFLRSGKDHFQNNYFGFKVI